MLDIDQGTYPFVTSSTLSLVVWTISLVLVQVIDPGVGRWRKATQVVGETDLPNRIIWMKGNRIREVGHEYGTTTGRPRRGVGLTSCDASQPLHLGLPLNSIDVLSGGYCENLCRL